MTIPTLSHAANLDSHYAVPAYQQLNKPPTTHELLSLIRQDCLVIMIAIEAEAEETDEHHEKIRQLHQEMEQLKRCYLDALFFYDLGDWDCAA
jgi:hypothetical protein